MRVAAIAMQSRAACGGIAGVARVVTGSAGNLYNRDVLFAAAKFLRKRSKCLLDHFDELFPLHSSPDGEARSLRVAVVIVVILVIFFAIAFVFLFVVFFLFWLLSKDDIGNRIRKV